ncbi:MAG TPA: universal stress protein [Candidatus Angelobacter sp.]|jgi:nucleotide-binding universal stress UspA family protein|nr:universal stress protein [Candidatus Angelobacter sp.]
MYSSIYVPLDNSDHSNACVDVAVRLAEAFGASCTGSHVYAARMHDYRFKQMEYTLPEEYQDEAELLRQRRIHDSLITTGLQLISDSYTDVMRYRCLERGIPFTVRAMDGKNWEELVRDISESSHDLVVMGALGMGAVKESRLGSVADRVVRRVRTDTLLVRRTGAGAMQGGIVVAVDGSPQCFGGLRTAIALSKALGCGVQAVAVYDPYLHYAVFNSIVDVLSEKASKVFRFKEQEALHEEIIDTGLAKIYESHLRVAQGVAASEGVDLPITLLDGKAFEQVVRFVREVEPWLLVCGRIGVHSDDGMDIGSNTDHLVRLVDCDVLVSSRCHLPPIDMRADASVVWTPEAESRMSRVPVAARGIARTAVLRWCTERGHSVVSSGDVESALDELMPYQRVMRRLDAVAETLASAERAMLTEPRLEQARAVCRVCGYASGADAPVECPVCGSAASSFDRIDTALLLADAATEGDAAEVGFDGHKLGWTMEARTLLHELPAGYLRRRVKAIVEKAARTRRLPAITRDVVEPYVLPELDALDGRAGPHRAPITTPSGGASMPRLPWSVEAESRIERIPEGFLRSLAREQVERVAVQVSADEVTALHVEAGIAEAKAQMRDALASNDDRPGGEAPGCPVKKPARASAQPAPDDTTIAPLREATTPQINPNVASSLEEIAALNEKSGRFDPNLAIDMTLLAASKRADLKGLNEITAGFIESLGKKMGYGHPASPLTHELTFTWTPEAEHRLDSVPDFCREMVRWRVEWFAKKRNLGTTITPDMVEGKYAAWGQVSEQIRDKGTTLPWSDDAIARLERIPESVRGEVMQAIEGNARAAGAERVDASLIDSMREQWQHSGDFHQGRFGFRA